MSDDRSDFDPASSIIGASKLTEVFGYWPSFHDAEVLEFFVWRREVLLENDRVQFPVLRLKVHLWELTDEIGSDGCLVTQKHTLATLEFRDVDDLQMSGFNYQNVINRMSFSYLQRRPAVNGEARAPFIVVTLGPCFGIEATLKCLEIEVVSAVAYSAA